jgi:hypothetical protein
MKKSFTGTSPNGDLTEAIRHALKKAAAEFNKNIAWTIKETGGDQLELGPISVKIQVDSSEGGGPGPNDPH